MRRVLPRPPCAAPAVPIRIAMPMARPGGGGDGATPPIGRNVRAPTAARAKGIIANTAVVVLPMLLLLLIVAIVLVHTGVHIHIAIDAALHIAKVTPAAAFRYCGHMYFTY